MLVSVTALGARADRTGAAARDIVNYLDGASKGDLARGGSRGPASPASAQLASPGGYYSDSPEQPGRWRGEGAVGLGDVVDPDSLRQVLLGRDPVTGQQLVTAEGSAGRARLPSIGSIDGDPTDLIPLSHAARIAGIDDSYMRRLARRSAISRSAEGSSPGDHSSPYSSPDRRSGAYLDAVKVDGQWMVARGELSRFVADREMPQVVMGYDVTFSAPKSLSIVWATGSPKVRVLCEAAFEAGVARGVEYLETHAIAVGRGSNQRPATGMLAASFRHSTNRELEPQLHEHVVIANMATTPTGDINALDGRGLFAHATTAGYLAEAEMQAACNRAGIAWTETHRGIANVEGVPIEAIRAMSTRRQQILSLTSELGVDSTHARQQAALATRAGKDQPVDLGELRSLWKERLGEAGFGLDQLAIATTAAPVRLWTPEDSDRLNRHLAGPSGVTEQQAVFDRRDVIQAIVDFAGGRLDADGVEAHADRWLASVEAVPVTDIDSSPVGLGGVRHTTPTMVRIEQSISDGYLGGHDNNAAVVPATIVDAAIARWEAATGHTLGADQVAMARSICGSGDRFQAVVGPAGSGKTAALEVAARAWEAAGYEVIGAAVNGTAAEVLERSTGIASRTVAGLVTRLDTATDQVLTGRTVVIIDEASTLGNRQHARLVHHVNQAGAAMRAIGDPAQHSAVEAGGMWARIVAAHPNRTPALTENLRQTIDEMADVRLANADYRAGRIAEAIERLDSNDRIVTAPTSEELLDQLAADWYVDRLTRPDTTTRMIAEHHRERRALNARAQQLLISDGTLAAEGATIGEATFHVGDQVISRSANRALHPTDDPRNYVRNGTPGTVVDITGRPGQERLIVDFEHRGPIGVDRIVLTCEVRPGIVGAITPAYAVTSHAAQGDTYLAGRMVATDTAKTEAVYVGLTRGTDDARLYCVAREPATIDTDPQLPRIVDERDQIEALRDQLSKPKAAETATEIAPDLPGIVHLLDQPLAHLETSDQPVAVAAARIVAERIRHEAITDPPPRLVALIGDRTDHQDPAVWDHAVTQTALCHARTGLDATTVSSIAHVPQAHRPEVADAIGAVKSAEASALSAMPTAELAGRRTEYINLSRGSDAREAAFARHDHQRSREAVSAAAARHEHAASRHHEATGQRGAHRDPDLIESTRRTAADRAQSLTAARHRIAITQERLERATSTHVDHDHLADRVELIDAALKPRIDSAVEHPAGYLTDTLGPRHDSDAAQWDEAATVIETYRHTVLGIEPGAGSLTSGHPALGPQPQERLAATVWQSVTQTINRLETGPSAEPLGVSQR